MRRSALRLLAAVSLAGCSPAPEKGNDAAPEAANAAPPALVERPEGAAASGIDAPMGAVPGPCGAEKAAALVGRAWSPALEAELRRLTGARAVNIVDHDGGDATLPPDAGRVNVLLNSRSEVILLDCG